MGEDQACPVLDTGVGVSLFVFTLPLPAIALWRTSPSHQGRGTYEDEWHIFANEKETPLRMQGVSRGLEGGNEPLSLMDR
jgi:hypothetical protein